MTKVDQLIPMRETLAIDDVIEVAQLSPEPGRALRLGWLFTRHAFRRFSSSLIGLPSVRWSGLSVRANDV